MKLIRGLVAAAVCGLLMSNPLHAQGRGSISGRVVDSTSQLPMQSVTVTIEGTQRGAITRIDGGFTLVDVPAGTSRLRVTRIGYTPQLKDVSITAGQVANALSAAWTLTKPPPACTYSSKALFNRSGHSGAS